MATATVDASKMQGILMPQKAKLSEEKKMAQIRSIETQVNQLQKELQNFQTTISNATNTINALEKYKELEKDSDSFAVLGPGVFAESVLKKSDKVFIEIGSIMVEKKVDDAIKLLEDNRKIIIGNMGEVQKAIADLQKYYTVLIKQAQKG